MQQRLKNVDWKLQDSKSIVHTQEMVANQAGEKLKQLESTIREEGLFCVEWCVIMSESMCTTLLIVSCDILLYP